MLFAEWGLPCTHLLIDHDTKFVTGFDAVLGEGHLRHLVCEYLAHYNAERPHQGKGNVPLGDSPPSAGELPETAVSEEPVVLPFPTRVECRERLGGLLKHYRRAA